MGTIKSALLSPRTILPEDNKAGYNRCQFEEQKIVDVVHTLATPLSTPIHHQRREWLFKYYVIK